MLKYKYFLKYEHAYSYYNKKMKDRKLNCVN